MPDEARRVGKGALFAPVPARAVGHAEPVIGPAEGPSASPILQREMPYRVRHTKAALTT